jgi:uncharacterized UPF0160 family protein
MYKKLYNKLILEIDAQDNGVSVAESTRYHISTHLGSRIGRMNLDWNAPETACVHTQFKKAMKIAEEELLYNLKYLNGQLQAVSIVKSCFDKR